MAKTRKKTVKKTSRSKKRVAQKKEQPLVLWCKQAWNYIWHGESATSWFLSLIVAFILIKFVFYPALGVLLGTQFPIVAVVSNSMEHDGSFDEWWAEHEDFYLQNEITKEEFLDYPFRNGFNKGDIMILFGIDEEDIEQGDVLVFWSKKPYPIIHRVSSIDIDEETGERIYQTKGDHNRNQVRQPPILDETNIRPYQIVGHAVLRIPYLGYVKILAVDGFTALFAR